MPIPGFDMPGSLGLGGYGMGTATPGGGVAPLPFAINGQTGGHYSATGIGGLLAGALVAPNQIAAFRWQDTRLLMIPTRISVQLLCTAFSSGISLDLAAYVARQMSTNSSGSGSVTVTNPTKSINSRMNPSILSSSGEFRVAGTVALTAGTQTLDGSPFATGIAKIQAVQDAPTVDLYALITGKYPIVLGNNEGIVIRLESLNLPASNTIKPYVTIEWVEVAGVPF